MQREPGVGELEVKRLRIVAHQTAYGFGCSFKQVLAVLAHTTDNAAPRSFLIRQRTGERDNSAPSDSLTTDIFVAMLNACRMFTSGSLSLRNSGASV